MPAKAPNELESVRIGRGLKGLLAGDRNAASWLFEEFAPGLRRRIAGRYPYLDLEDLLHDAFVFFFQHQGKVLRDYLERVPADQYSAFGLERHLWDLTCGLAANRRRRARSELAHQPPDFSLELDALPAARDEEELLGQRDLLARLDLCLLGRGRRLALYGRFRFVDGHDPEEIAQITGWSMKATYKLKQAFSQALLACARWLGLLPA